MGFLDGLFSPLITQAANARTAYTTGQQQGEHDRLAQSMQMLALQRQQSQDALKAALDQRTLRTPVLGDPGYAKAHGDVAGAEASARVPAAVDQARQIAPITTGQKVDEAKQLAPIHTQEAVNTQSALIPGKVSEFAALTPAMVSRGAKMAAAETPAMVDRARQTAQATSDFQAPIGAVDPTTGQTTWMTRSEALNKGKPAPGGNGGLSGSAQNMQARLLGAVSEGRLADQRMDAFTAKHTKDGKLDVGSLDQIMGNTATNLASSHKLTDIVAQGLSEGHMNSSNPEYMQFLRDARLIARAEQLMSARGGSEAMANDNAFLARGGANAPVATLEAASRSRKALFGKMGAIMQTLTPEQATKLQAGLDALAKDDANFDYAGVGKAIGGGGAPPNDLIAKYNAAVDHLRAEGRDAEIAKLPKPPGMP